VKKIIILSLSAVTLVREKFLDPITVPLLKESQARSLLGLNAEATFDNFWGSILLP